MTAIDLLIQFIGFFLQTAPIALLMGISFEEENLKLSRTKTIMLLLVLVIVSSVGFAVWEISMPKDDRDTLQSIANIFMAVFIAIVFCVFFRLIKAPVLSKLIVMTILTHYAAILFTVNGEILAMLDVYSDHVYSSYELFTNFILTLVTFPVVYLFMVKILRPAINLSDNKILRRGLIYFCLAFLLYCVAVMFFDFSFERTFLKNIRVMALFFAFIFTEGILYYMFFSETRLALRNAQLESRIRSFNEQYRRINQGIEESRRLRHDMRHHLNAISIMNKNGSTKELTEYLESYSAAYSELDNISLCGYHAVDNALLYYLGLAKERKIILKTEFQTLSPDMEFDVTDMTVLIGNLMENAIEACERLSEEEKFIRISIKQTDAELLIKLENSCSAELNARPDFTDSESFVSTKHTKHSGQGLKSISLVAEKYGGSAEYKCENGIFTARAVLNIP